MPGKQWMGVTGWGRRFVLLASLILALAAPRPAAAQLSSVTGFVQDRSGRGIGGAMITASAGPSAGRRTFSAASGLYFLSGLVPGAYTFTAEAPGFDADVRRFLLTPGLTSRLNFVLNPRATRGGVLQGTVTNTQNGRAVSGAVVRVSGGAGLPARQAVTDDGGFFQLTDLEPATYRVEVVRQGFLPASRNASVRAGRVTTTRFELLPRARELGSLEGRIVDGRGRGIGNARARLVSGVSAGLEAHASSSGLYRIGSVVPDLYEVEFSAPGFVTQRISGAAVQAGRATVLDAVLAAEGAAVAAVVEGFVLDAFGIPIPGARVETISGPALGRFDVAGPDGFYRIRDLPPGRYTLFAAAGGFQSRTRVTEPAAGATVREDFSLLRAVRIGGTLFGKVSGPGGIGLSGVLVRLTAGPAAGRTTTTDADGEYAFAELPRGEHAVTFTREGFRERVLTGVRIEEGETTVLNVDLTADGGGAGTLRGTVTDLAGTAVPDVLVELRRNGTAVRTLTTDALGRFTAADLEPGVYEARLTRAGFEPAAVDGILIVAGETTEITPRLTPLGGGTAVIEGSVRDTTGRAVQAALVELVGPSGPRSTRTDPEGRFAFTGLPAGSGYNVTVSAPGLVSDSRVGLALFEGQRVDLRFTLRPEGAISGIAGTVRNAFGQPLAGALVTIVSGALTGEQRVTSSDGRFNFTGLPAGTYVLEAQAPRLRAVRRTVFVRPGSTAFVNFFLPRQ